MEKDS